MPTTLKSAVQKYLRSANRARGTRDEYNTTLTKWREWGGGVPIERLGRKEIRDFLHWVYDRALANEGTNPGRTANKAREHLRAVISWAWEQDIIEMPPRFPKPVPQRDVAGRHYFTKAEINALYFATHQLRRPKGWDQPLTVGKFWQAALVVFFNYGLDSGTVWGTAPFHEPILWRHVSWSRESPDREVKLRSPWGWLFYRRVKTGKAFCRPMNRIVHAHIKSLMPIVRTPTPRCSSAAARARTCDSGCSVSLPASSPRPMLKMASKSRGCSRIYERRAPPTTMNTCRSRQSRSSVIRLGESPTAITPTGRRWRLRPSPLFRSRPPSRRWSRASMASARAVGDPSRTRPDVGLGPPKHGNGNHLRASADFPDARNFGQSDCVGRGVICAGGVPAELTQDTLTWCN